MPAANKASQRDTKTAASLWFSCLCWRRYMPMKFLYRSLTLVILFIGFIQLYGVGERISSALWRLYKFYGSNGEGITVGTSMALITYVVSICLIVVSGVIYKKSNDSIALALARLSSFILLFGLLLLTLLLLSPLAYFYSR
ncbi:hypothetical protein MHM98_05210 [Psychrobium sp. MM17-31]|uniref:hypothetical protein n=1 Tax=Psychrobium sp. MM17-31 TaxID=2917758 RepID=UPI001EF66063|nr:hypothetical protein [Psychrobium sp. MM17-31]MCG7530754.1 hypothetical protein [Psychrobium sp. MM17-31]